MNDKPIKNRYRIQNKRGQVLCHADTAQKVADIITGLGAELCRTQYAVDLTGRAAFPYTTFKRDDLSGAFIGTHHATYDQVMGVLL